MMTNQRVVWTVSWLAVLLPCLQRSASFTIKIISPQTRRFASHHATSVSFSLAAVPVSEPVAIGFIGCGTIAKAIATGLLTQDVVKIQSIAVSFRSEAKSKALKESFPDMVSVHQDNQEVVDTSDIVFITVLPQQTTSVLQRLTFDTTRHFLVSLVSTSTLDGLARDSNLPPEQVSKVICLPSVAKHNGVSLVYPPQPDNPMLLKMLSSLGGFVECSTSQEMNSMMVIGGLMGSLYGILRGNRDWLIQKGISPSNASYFVGKMYWGMMQDAVENCEDAQRFDELVQEQTPGGLNEQALHNLETLGMLNAYDTAMNALLSRLEGTSDGSLPTDETNE